MSNLIREFSNGKYGKIRAIYLNGTVYFVAIDVAKSLGYVDAFGAIRKNVDEEDKIVVNEKTLKKMASELKTVFNTVFKIEFSSPRGLTLINESGLNSLILRSHLPAAKEIKHWITSEVMPSIRQNGFYVKADSAQLILFPQLSDLEKFVLLKDFIKDCAIIEDVTLRDDLIKSAFALLKI